MIRSVDVRIDQKTWKASVPAKIAAISGSTNVDMALVLLHCALWTRPPKAMGFDLSDMWAWMRYAPAIDPRFNLQLRQEWGDVDPHQKTLLSDDLGVGMTTYLMAETLGCLEFANTGFAITRIFNNQLKLLKKGRRGPAKSPDYISRLPNGKFAVLECKGSQTSIASLENLLDRGKAQKANLVAKAGAKIEHSLVAGLFIPQWKSKENATVIIRDPDFGKVGKLINEASVEDLSLAIVQIGIAKQLALVGMFDSANLLATTPIKDLEAIGEQFSRTLTAAPATEVVRLRYPNAQDGASAVEFNYDYSSLLKRLTLGSDLRRNLLEVAHFSTEERWKNYSDKTESTVVTPYGAKLTLKWLTRR